MMKARLIKRHEAAEIINRRRAKKKNAAPSPTVIEPGDAVREWVEQHRAQRPHPRQAFADLFIQPQPQS